MAHCNIVVMASADQWIFRIVIPANAGIHFAQALGLDYLQATAKSTWMTSHSAVVERLQRSLG
jgi:hypothetical protein